MTYTITPAKDGDYILVEVHGVVTLDIASQWTMEAHTLGKQLGLRKYLVDVTAAVNKDSTLDQYRFANSSMVEDTAVDRYAKIAVLVAPEDHSHDFVETVCRNVGLNFRLFRKRDEAMAFLGCSQQQMQQSS
ncbi:MAG: hypothetical protein P8103_08015 [Candidatus Thiodiazotropha sp.]|jgi:hypothetical protein